jgi:pSer/pThr/pTyr-binding forkhead associated (FHA) protein
LIGFGEDLAAGFGKGACAAAGFWYTDAQQPQEAFMAAIIVGPGEQEGLYLPLGKKTSVIGRDESLPLQVQDEQASRRHVQIRFEAARNSYIATDMKSANGTLINGRPLIGEIELRDGDELRIGMTTLLFTTTMPKDKANAMEVFKAAGQRHRSTIVRER